ncbi:MAG: nucleoside kinase [Bacteroides sp.]|nr:nucleoside kinase [Bacteroides sp.]MBD5425365.1 nucleoside kinase [Bacteroides sp.]
MDKNLEIFCANIGEYIKVEGGETLHSVARRLAPQLGFEPICAHVNNKNEGLQYRVYMPKMVEFMSVDSASGMRTYVRSLCMMLYRAVQSVFPATTLKIEHSIGHGWFCRLSPNVEITPQVISRLKAELQRLHSANLPFEYFEQLTGDVIDLFDKQGLNEKVKLLESLRPLYTKFYRLEGLADSYYGCLAPTTGAIDSFDLVAYEDGFILLGRNQKCDPRPKMFRAFTDYVLFNRIVGVSNVGEMNEVTERGEARSLINVAEALHNNKIAHIADDITRRYEQGGARIVLVAGPSSSGKTTFTKRLGIQLMTNLLEPKMISLDDYFVNRADTPLDADGDYDYESLYALDLKQFNADLSALLRGEEIELPTYNFAKGMREYNGRKLSLTDRSILLIEGIHGLNPQLTESIAAEMKYKVYVSALTTLSLDNHNWVPTSDNRLLRRIIRDNAYRGVGASETIRRWASVRRGEEKWIFPFQENADAMFNSSLLFELGVLKERGEELLKRVPQDEPEYAEAYRLRKFLSYFKPIEEHYIPSTSLIREFIGGSSFNY